MEQGFTKDLAWFYIGNVTLTSHN